MQNRQNQIYETYWSYTAAFTDYNGEQFINALKTCVEFLSTQSNNYYTQEKYKKLQEKLCKSARIEDVSARKAINQLVKLGFIKPYLQGYVPECIDYINANTDRKRQSILSKIVYRFSNFDNSITDPANLGNGQINFLIKTLEEVGSLDKNDLIALISTDIKKYPKGFLNKNELNEISKKAINDGFVERKYNQIAHLKNLLSKLDDLQVHDNVLYFKTDAIRLFGDEEEQKNVRDPYLQRVYKNELETESKDFFKCDMPKCMLEGLSHPILIASHIKPYKDSNEDEAFDVNNGLLLSKSMDSLFDLGYMTFNEKGIIIPASILNQDMVQYLSKFKLNDKFINEKRMNYMTYHREHVFEKRFSTRKINGNNL